MRRSQARDCRQSSRGHTITRSGRWLTGEPVYRVVAVLRCEASLERIASTVSQTRPRRRILVLHLIHQARGNKARIRQTEQLRSIRFDQLDTFPSVVELAAVGSENLNSDGD